jgi:MFS family permease
VPIDPSSRRRTLIAFSLASAGWAFSFGLSIPLGSLWQKDAGCSAGIIGLSTSIYYLGVVIASLLLPRLLPCGARRLIIAALLIQAVVVALFPWVWGCPSWFLLRLLSGIATAVCLVPMETLINHNAPPASRAQDFSYYAVSVALGVGLGPMVGLPLYPFTPYLAFFLGSLTALLAALVLWVGFPEQPFPEEDKGKAGLRWHEHTLSLGTAWFQGFLEGGMLTFLSFYLLGLGYSEPAVSGLLGALFLGVVLVQLPGAWLADRFGLMRTLMVCHTLVLTCLVLLPFSRSAMPLCALLFTVGSACALLYPLGLTLIGERVPASNLATANSWYLAMNCLGSLTGPWVLGLAIDRWGQGSLFTIGFVAGALVLLAWFLFERRQRQRQRRAVGGWVPSGAATRRAG